MKYIIWIIFILYSIIMLFFTFMPGSGVSSEYDKLFHYIAFLIFTILLAYSSRSIAITVTVAIVLTILTEVIQGQIGRDFSYWDMLADTAGIITGTLLYYALK